MLSLPATRWVSAIGRWWILLYIAVYPQYKRRIEGTMATGKTTTLTFRIEPALKDALRAAAEQEHRSIANMVAVMIRDYCGRNGVTIAKTGVPAAGIASIKSARPKSARVKNKP